MTYLEELKREIEGQVKSFKFCLASDINVEQIDRVTHAITNSAFLMNLYNAEDTNKIMHNYLLRIKELKQALYSSDIEEYILNILEYIRFMCMKEDFIGISDILYFESLSESRITSALLGKGTAISQVYFMQDLLPEQEKGRISIVRKASSTNPYDTKEYFHVIFLTESEVLDPYHYNGLLSNREPIFSYNNLVERKALNSIKQEKARLHVSNYLIKELGIDIISEEIIREEMTFEEKNEAIINYIKENYTNYKVPVKHFSIVINNHLIEVSKLLELFYIANNIPYEIIASEEKENARFVIGDNNKRIIVNIYNEIEDSMEQAKLKLVSPDNQ